MDFDRPAGTNVFDTPERIGKPTRRIDGPLKVTGTAPYAYERHDVVAGQLYGYPVGSTIAKGRITAMDTSAAKDATGVVAVITTLDIAPLPLGMNNVARLFGGDVIEHYHQAIAVVVAETFEQARAAASLICTTYDEEATDFDLEAGFRLMEGGGEPDTDLGDFDAAFASAAVTLDQMYRTPSQSHAMMEPHASVVDWSTGNDMHVWTSHQVIAWDKASLATTFGLEEDRIRVESPFIGGGFGSKLWLRADAALAAIGSRATGRPVKVALPRPFIANNTTHRSATIQLSGLARTRMGA